MRDPVEIDPGEHVWEDQRKAYDAVRSRCAESFSSRVTARRAIPHSLDGVEHRAYRAVVDRFLTDERVAAQEPVCRTHAVSIVDRTRRITLAADRPAVREKPPVGGWARVPVVLE